MKILIIGSNSFIGHALLEKTGANLFNDIYNSDIRKPIKLSFHYKERYDLVYHFASPSSQVLFNRNPEYCIDTTLRGFKNVLDYCRRTGAKLIYPSTGLLNHAINNTYSMCKYLCEKMAKKSGVETLGLRIYAGYGPGEDHKRDYASIITIFLKAMMQENHPIVYGDGKQKRDFIYIDDLVKRILKYSETETGIINLGSGKSYSFNHIIKTINNILGTKIAPMFLPKPKGYVEKTECLNSPIKTIPLEKGIKKTYESYCNNNN